MLGLQGDLLGISFQFRTSSRTIFAALSLDDIWRCFGVAQSAVAQPSRPQRPRRQCAWESSDLVQVSNYGSLVEWPQGHDACIRKKAHVDSGTFTILASDDWLSGNWQARAPLIALRS